MFTKIKYIMKVDDLCCCFLALTLVWTSSTDSTTTTGPPHDRLVICRLLSWSTNYLGRGKFNIEDLDPNMCTHIVYRSANMNATSYTLKAYSTHVDLDKADGQPGGYRRVVNLKQSYPHLRVLLSIIVTGVVDPGHFSTMVGNSTLRSTFVNSISDWMTEYKMDGVDIDWQYPTWFGGKPEDKDNFIVLLQDIKAKFEGRNLTLMVSLPPWKGTLQNSFNLPDIGKYADLVHVWCYLYFTHTSTVAGPMSALSSSTILDENNVEFSIHTVLSAGVPADKLILGVPFYGGKYIKTAGNPRDLYLGATIEKQGWESKYFESLLIIGYNEICATVQNKSKNWEVRWDEESSTPYAVQGDRVMVFDDQRSVALKVRFAMKRKLRGVAVDSVHLDDFLGDCNLEADQHDASREVLEAKQQHRFFPKVVHIFKDKLKKKIPKLVSDPFLQSTRGIFKVISQSDMQLVPPSRRNFQFPLLQTVEEAILLSVQEALLEESFQEYIKIYQQNAHFDFTKYTRM